MDWKSQEAGPSFSTSSPYDACTGLRCRSRRTCTLMEWKTQEAGPLFSTSLNDDECSSFTLNA